MSFECQKCKHTFCCLYLGQRTCAEHCNQRDYFCVSCHLYNIDEKSPAEICQRCNFSSECYGYKYLGRINGRDSYNWQQSCIDHCTLKDCPHKDEVAVELNRIIQPPDHSHRIRNGSAQQTIDVQQQGAGTQQLENRVTPILSGKGHPRMVLRISEKNRSGLKRILATKRVRQAKRRRERSWRCWNEGSGFRLCAATVNGSGSTGGPY